VASPRKKRKSHGYSFASLEEEKRGKNRRRGGIAYPQTRGQNGGEGRRNGKNDVLVAREERSLSTPPPLPSKEKRERGEGG